MQNNNTIAVTNERFTPAFDMLRKYLTLRGIDRLREAVPEQIDGIHEYALEEVLPVFEEIRERFKIKRPITLRSFDRICRKENIAVIYYKPDKHTYGTYFRGDSDGLKENRPVITIDPALAGQKQRMVAAHELAHHFLWTKHRTEEAYKYSEDDLKIADAGRLTSAARLVAEMEADALASLLLTANGGARCPRK